MASFTAATFLQTGIISVALISSPSPFYLRRPKVGQLLIYYNYPRIRAESAQTLVRNVLEAKEHAVHTLLPLSKTPLTDRQTTC